MKLGAFFTLAALAACVRGAPSASSTLRPELASGGPASAASPPAAPSSPADPCAAEQTTLAIETCLTERRRAIEADIRRALTRFASVLSARGVGEAASLVAASQTDWERYRDAQCLLHEKLSEGGSIARIAVAYCRHDLAQARLADLRSLEGSVVE